MKKPIGIVLSVVLSLVLAAGGLAGQDRSHLSPGSMNGPHGPMTRLDFVTAKSLTAEHFGQKNGELGDAAVTFGRHEDRGAMGSALSTARVAQ